MVLAEVGFCETGTSEQWFIYFIYLIRTEYMCVCVSVVELSDWHSGWDSLVFYTTGSSDSSAQHPWSLWPDERMFVERRQRLEHTDKGVTVFKKQVSTFMKGQAEFKAACFTPLLWKWQRQGGHLVASLIDSHLPGCRAQRQLQQNLLSSPRLSTSIQRMQSFMIDWY